MADLTLTSNAPDIALHMFDDVPTNDFIELIIGEGIRKVVQIVYDVSRCSRIDVHSNCTRDLICSAADVQDLTNGSLLSLAG